MQCYILHIQPEMFRVGEVGNRLTENMSLLSQEVDRIALSI